MNYFPTTIIDNFYKDPQKIIDYAMSLEFYPSDGNYPGKRTQRLHMLPDTTMYNLISKKILSIFFDMDKPCEYELWTEFSVSVNSKDDELNNNWIHQDGDECILAGLVYLSNTTGTEIFDLKQDVEYNYKPALSRKEYYKEGYVEDRNKYVEELTSYTNQFNKSIDIDGKFNRLVCYDPDVFHTPAKFTSEEPRLTQVFFLRYFRCNELTPLQRVNSINL